MILRDLSIGDTFRFANVDVTDGRGPIQEAFKDRDMRVVAVSAGEGLYECCYADDDTRKTMTSFFSDRVVVPITKADDTRFSFDVEIVRVDQERKTVIFYAPATFDEAAATIMFEYATTKVTDVVGERFRVTMERLND